MSGQFLPNDVDVWLEVAHQLAEEAGELVRNAIGDRGKQIETKASFADLVTETDKNVELLLKNGFKEHFPDHKFIGEESTAAGAKSELTDDPTWIVDPVDGTMNFVHGLPFVAISIGLAFQKEVILGIVYIPVLYKMYSAVKARGAFCNGEKLSVSGQTDLSQALICMETGSNRQPEVLNQVFANYQTLASKVHGLRSLGSAAVNMCYVASGLVDCYYEYSIHCWDIAAGKVIVEEAGGVVIDPEGGPLDLLSRRVLCAASPELASLVSGNLQHILLPRD